jgi:hypothetical protein
MDLSISKIAYTQDESVLLHLLQEFTSFGLEFTKDDEKYKRFIRLVIELDKFVALHRTRTNDLLIYMEKIETARMEFSKLRNRNKDLESKVAELESANNKIIEGYLETSVAAKNQN